MLKKIVLMLILVAVMLVVFCSCGAKDVDLKYDNGKLGGLRGMGGVGWGAVVEFSPSSASMTIDTVSICGRLVGAGDNLIFEVLIWDKEKKELFCGSFSHKLFHESSDWIAIDIPKTIVEDNFYVIVIPNTSKDNGIYIGYDSSANNGRSAVLQNWQFQDSGMTANWMIRVSGKMK